MFLKNLDTLEQEITPEEIQVFLEKDARRRLALEKYLSKLADAFAEIEAKEVRVSDVVMSAKTYAVFRKGAHEYLDVETKIVYIKKGCMGNVWGAFVWVVRDLAYQEVRVYGENDPNFEKDFPQFAKAHKELKHD